MIPLPLRWCTSLAFGLAACCLLWSLGGYGLLHNNEGLYAQIPREMLASHNFIIPYLNGVPYIEKPPLLYWLIAGSYWLFCISEFAARFVPAIAGFLTLLIAFVTARTYLSARAAFLVVLILGTSLGYAVSCRMVFFDVVFTLFLTAALLCYFDWEQTSRRSQLRLGYVLLGLAVLTKGLVALILAGLVVIIYYLIARKPCQQWWQAWDIWGMLFFLAITVPWHILAAYQDPNFAWFYFINEHFLRFLGEREPKDYYHGPIYYYSYRVFIYLLPWSLLFPLFFMRKQNTKEGKPLMRFLAIWFWTFFIFFSLSKAKANYYLITALPSLALLLSHKVNEMLENKQKLIAYLILPFQIFCLFIAGIILLYKLRLFTLNYAWFTADIEMALRHISGLLLAGLTLCGLVALFLNFKPNKVGKLSEPIFLVTGVSSTLLIMIATQLAPLVEHMFSARPIVRQLQMDTDHTCLYRDYEKISSFVFYLQQPLPIIDSRSNDLLYGQKKGIHPDLFLADDVTNILQRCRIIILHSERGAEFEARFINYQPIYKDKKVSVYKD
jgi:4-amino-4-deoxy-L-arabinose transferase-like glycosyltransferase